MGSGSVHSPVNRLFPRTHSPAGSAPNSAHSSASHGSKNLIEFEIKSDLVGNGSGSEGNSQNSDNGNS